MHMAMAMMEMRPQMQVECDIWNPSLYAEPAGFVNNQLNMPVEKKSPPLQKGAGSEECPLAF